jgi:putative transposase
MLNDAELEAYIVRLGFPAWAADYIRNARINSPSREVGGGESSMTVVWVSDEKMPFTQDLESRTHELVFARMQDADPSVLEIWAQPPPIRVFALDKTGRRAGHWYTPDFLTLYVHRCAFAEIKKISDLKTLAIEKPDQWQFIDNRWHYVPAETAATELGLPHETYSTDDLNPVLARNFIFLRDYREAPDSALGVETLECLRRAVANPEGVVIAHLLPPRGNFDADSIYLAIARNLIFAPLLDQDLSDTARCRVFSDQAAYKLYKLCVTEAQRQHGRQIH